jgi:hypothetical protein
VICYIFIWVLGVCCSRDAFSYGSLIFILYYCVFVPFWKSWIRLLFELLVFLYVDGFDLPIRFSLQGELSLPVWIWNDSLSCGYLGWSGYMYLVFNPVYIQISHIVLLLYEIYTMYCCEIGLCLGVKKRLYSQCAC